MTQDLHAASNAVIAKYMDKEVTVKMSRSDAHGLALLLKDRLNIAWDSLSDTERHDLSRLHAILFRA